MIFIARFRVVCSGKARGFADKVAQFFAGAFSKLVIKPIVLQTTEFWLENTIQCFVFVLVKKDTVGVVGAKPFRFRQEQFRLVDTACDLLFDVIQLVALVVQNAELNLEVGNMRINPAAFFWRTRFRAYLDPYRLTAVSERLDLFRTR